MESVPRGLEMTLKYINVQTVLDLYLQARTVGARLDGIRAQGAGNDPEIYK